MSSQVLIPDQAELSQQAGPDGIEVPAFVQNKELIRWVAEWAALCKPAHIHWCDGSQQEYDRLCEEMVGTFNAKLPSGKKFIGAYDVDLTQDFLQALVNHARICLHVNVRYGRNLHHVVEAIFKATARALRAATAREGSGVVPSTKGVL